MRSLALIARRVVKGGVALSSRMFFWSGVGGGDDGEGVGEVSEGGGLRAGEGRGGSFTLAFFWFCGVGGVVFGGLGFFGEALGVSESPDRCDMKISVITATYEREGTVASACESLAEQSYPDVEWVVVDGNSKDGTLEVIEASERQPDVIVSESDRGIYDALNKGLKLVTGDVVGFLHSDDFYPDSGVLRRVAEAFEDSSVDAVYGDLEYVAERGPEEGEGREGNSGGFRVVRYWKSGEYGRQKFRRGWMPPHPTFFMRRKHYEDFGGFDERHGIAADYDGMLRYLWRERLNAVYIPQVQMRMRLGGMSNRSLGAMWRKSMQDLAVMRAHGLGISTLVMKNLRKVPQFIQRR